MFTFSWLCRVLHSEWVGIRGDLYCTVVVNICRFGTCKIGSVRVGVCSGTRRVKGRINSRFMGTIGTGPNVMLKLTAKTSPVPACGCVYRRCGGKLMDLRGIGAFGLSRCITLPGGSGGDCCAFVRIRFFGGASVGRRGIRFLGNGTSSISRRYHTCSGLVESTKNVSVRLLNINEGNRVNFGRPSGRFAGNSFGIGLARDAVRTGSGCFSRGPVPRCTLAVNINSVVDTGGVVLVTANGTGTSTMGTLISNRISPTYPTSVLRFRHSAIVCLSGSTTDLLWLGCGCGLQDLIYFKTFFLSYAVQRVAREFCHVVAGEAMLVFYLTR